MKQKLIEIFQKFFQYWDRNHTAIESIKKNQFWQNWAFGPFRVAGLLTIGPSD